ncbi:L,D-transpeptidase [Pantoea sp. Nvir]|nr:L,D-transpeptidase [Pantoea sp. Nvir]MXP66281.1 L,D-transpeptidase [Pantoea sp. Nvir]
MLLSIKNNNGVFVLLALEIFSTSLHFTQAMCAEHTTISISESKQRLLQEFADKEPPFYLAYLALLYAAHNMQPMWRDRAAVQQFQQQLVEVAMSGVQPQFTRWVDRLIDPNLSDFARDVIFSDAMLGYLQFVSSIPIQGERCLYGNVPYKLEQPSVALVNKWQNAVPSGSSVTFLSSLVPQHPQYPPMHDALRQLLIDSRPWPRLKNHETLRPGQISNDVPALREILRRTGVLFAQVVSLKRTDDVVPPKARISMDHILPLVESSSVDVNNLLEHRPSAAVKDMMNRTVGNNYNKILYDPKLVRAVKRFQRWQGLGSDGTIGRRTREWLNVTPQMRAALLALNIQRLRLLPVDMHNGIMVNIPNFSLTYYNNGIKILSSRVIVGRPDRKTPLMRSTINNVVLNPPWNVPRKLVRKDILPKLKQDPGYLYKHGYTLFSGSRTHPKIINPNIIDWNVISASSFPYRLRQAPGKMNALGRYKFNMPSSDAIYLHDTPNHDLFQNDIRALSSGCVRVNKASELASLLLLEVGWDTSRISDQLKQGSTRYVQIRHCIPVNLYYLTAWVADDGNPQFRTDIYNYDNLAHCDVQLLEHVGKLLL